MICYTDGSCIPNPGKGGWAYCLVEENKLITDFNGSHKSTTNNRMEYTALIKALENHGILIKEIRTDSMLLVKTCNSWRHIWKKKEWKRKKQKEIKNLDLVLRMDFLLEKYKPIVSWIKSHNGNEFNEHVDSLANEAINGE